MIDSSSHLDDLARLFRYTPIENEGREAAARLSLVVDSTVETGPRGLTEQKIQDEWGARHQSLFGFNVFPYASVYLEDNGKMGGDIGDTMARIYGDAGYYPSGGESPDHLVTALEFCAHEIDNADDSGSVFAPFVDHQMFSWLPGFVFAVYRRTDGYYADLVTHTLEALISKRRALQREFVAPEARPDVEQGATTTTRDFARYFVSAARSGLFLARDDISGMARALKLPTGFGSREQMLTTMLESARTYKKEVELAALLDSLCESEDDQWLMLAEKAEVAALQYWSNVWIARLQKSRELIKQLSTLS